MINLNGTIQPREQPVIPASNRAFRYADGLFETIRVFNGKLPFLNRHWKRLSAGMQLLRFDVPPHFSPDFFEKEIFKLIQNDRNWRIRLTVWRSGSGFYTPETDVPEFLIEANPLAAGCFEWNEKGLEVAIFPDIFLPSCQPAPRGAAWRLSSLKTCNALPFVLAAIFKKENSPGECIMLNHEGRIACGGSSNVFIFRQGRLVTPPLSEGCIAGTMREAMLEIAVQKGYPVDESPVYVEELLAADEIFFTNAIKGIQWAGSIKGREKRYKHEASLRLFSALNELVS